MKFLLLLLCFIVSFRAIAQPVAPVRDTCMQVTVPLEAPAFRKMINSQFSYAILGKEAPVSGFKVETAKPSITLTGTIAKTKTR
ncbi:MAG: hypothetical protein JWQ30_492, partial [Sediminibacterium sp.]|nr:hypothetical protein [Sediminibacterium sp.]